MSLSLVVLAAWMGSRYGWLKQIDTFWPSGQSLLEYSIYDAMNAWFDHIVLVIRKEFEQAFVDKFDSMLNVIPSYDFVYQEIDQWREKPRWTLDATLCAHSVVSWPFAVINADDWYGTTSYQQLVKNLKNCSSNESFLVWYTLRNTLSEYGTVNRGVCHVDSTWCLTDVTERYALWYVWDIIQDREWNIFEWDETVSMNFWWFHNSFFDQANTLLETFKATYSDQPKAEMVIPDAVDTLIDASSITCCVVSSNDPWQGVTNPEDKQRVAQAFETMHFENSYPEDLWS